MLRGTVLTGMLLVLLMALANGSVWNSAQTSGIQTWNSTGSWSTQDIPNAIDAVADFTGTVIVGSLTLTLDGDETIGTLTVPQENNKTLTISSGSPDTSTLTLATSTGTPTLSIAGNANTKVIISAVIAGDQGFTKTNAGTLILTGANTFTGTLSYRSGTLILSGGDNRLAAGVSLTIGALTNTTIVQLGDATAKSDETVSGLTTAGTGTNSVVGGNASAVSTLTVNSTVASTYSGFLGSGTPGPSAANNLALLKTGPAALTLTNGGNTFTGGVTLNAGNLAFVTGALNNNTITVTGTSTLTWSTPGDTTDLSGKIILGDGFTLTLGVSGGATDNTIFASTIATSGGNTGAIVKGNAGILTITAPQIYTGGTRVNNGRLILTGGDNRLSTAGIITLGSGANSGVVQLGDSTGVSNQTVAGLAIVGSGVNNAIVGGNAANSILTINNTAAGNIGAASSPILGGAGTNENNLTLVKTGAGSVSLSKTNTFTGDVVLNGGALIVTNNSSLGTGTKTVTISGSVDAPSLRLNNASGVALAPGIGFVTSNDDATAPAIVNVAGNNVIGGGITLADGGYGGGQTRILVNGGSLTIGGPITAAATALSNRTLILDGAGNGAASGVIADNGAIGVSITKLGTGTWTLSAANTYTGDTTISAGRLNITTAQTGAGAITVADGSTLGVTLAAAGQTLAPSALTLNLVTTGTALDLNLGSFSNPSLPLISTGVFTTAGAGSNVINISGTGLSVGIFDLIDYTSFGGSGFAGLALGTTPARVTASLLNTAGKVQLDITAFDIPKWTGAISGDWDVNDGPDPTTGIGTVNWKEANSGTATRYLQFGDSVDSVLFDDTATGTTTINLTTTLTPNSVTVNNSLLDYTFTGPGKLSGATTVLKTGTGTLIFVNNGGNDYTGTTTINGGTLQIGDGLTFDAGQLGSGNIVLGPAGTLALDRPAGAGQDITLSNLISGTGTIVQRGEDTVTLSGNSSGFDGVVQVVSGTLKLGSANALGSTVGGTFVGSGATLDISGFAIAEAVTLNGSTLLQVTGTSSTSGNITLVGGGILDSVAGTLTISGNIGGTGGLTKSDGGNLVLSGISSFTGGFISNGGTVTLSNTNTFGGGLTINGGTVILAADQSYTGGTTVTQGTLQIGANSSATSGSAGSEDIVLAPGDGQTATLNILRGDNVLNITKNITSTGTGTNAVTIGAAGVTSPSGTVTFSGTNTFTGNVTISGGALRITNSSALGIGPKTVIIQGNSRPALLLDGAGGDITLAADIAINLSSDGGAGGLANNPGGIVNVAGDNVINGHIAVTNGGGGNGKIVVNGGTLTLAGLIDGATGTAARSLLLGGSGNGTVSGVIADWFDTGAGANRVTSISKDGGGDWTLTGANTFTGSVAITEGTVSVNAIDATATNAQPLGEGVSAITFGAATTAGTLEYTGASAATLNRPITVSGVGGGIVRNSSSQLLTLAGTLTKNARLLTLTGGSFNVTGQIVGAAANSDLIVDGATVTLSNATNTYNGPTRVIDGGTLKNGVDNAVPSTTSAVTLGEATNNTNGTYDLNGFNQTLTGLATAGAGTHIVTNSGASGTNTLTQTGTSVFDGRIQDGATAAIAVTKSTTGTFTLSGASTYSGATTITGGTLIVSGSLNGTASVAVAGGTLAGAGTITTSGDGGLTVGAGGILAPGNNGVGTLTLALGTGVLDASAAAGGTGWLKFQLGVTSDEIVLTNGTLNLGTGLDLDDFTFTKATGFGPGTYVLFATPDAIAATLGTNVSGTVLGFGATLEFADGGNQLVLNVVPEPGTLTTVVGGLGMLVGLQRCRRRSVRSVST